MLWLCLGLTMILLFVFINLPHIVTSQIEKRLPRVSGSNTIEFSIQKIGFFNTVISKIHVSKGLSIDSINIDYDIKGYSSVQLSKVTISGLVLDLTLDDNNQIKITEFNFPKSSNIASEKTDLSFLPFLPEKIVLQNAKVVLHTANDDFLIPFDVLSTISSKDGKIVAQSVLYPFGEKINTLVTYDMNKGIEFVKVEGKSFDFGHIDQFISQKTNKVQLKGPVDFNLESSSPQTKWKIWLSQIGFVKPFEAVVKDISTTLLIDNQKINGDGTFSVSHSMLPETVMEYGLVLDLKNNYLFDLTLKNSKTDPYQITYESSLASIKNPELSVWFHGTPEKSKGKITLKGKQGRVQFQQQHLSFENPQIQSDIVTDFTDHGEGVSSTVAVAATRIKLKSEAMESSFPQALVSGRVSLDKNNTPWGNMILTASEGKITYPEFKTTASGINIEMPIRYPAAGKRVYGKYSIPAISYNNQYVFSTSGQILQTGFKEVQVTGGVTLKKLPDINTEFTSTIGFEKGLRAALDFQTNVFKLSFSDIEKLIPQKLQTAKVDVTAFAKGKAEYINHQIKTSMQINIKDGKIHMPDTNLTATGINSVVELKDLLVLESVPGQVLTIDSIEVDKFKIKDAKIRFSIEDAKSLLVENIRFKWCNGLVSTESIRFPQANNTYSLTLYCDRLEMTQLLKQMGAFNAQGSGTLNGRIPVIYSDGNISFDNGFLFSTPGSGGKVIIANTDKITAGIPMDNPQFGQLDLAREALKDFDYQWAKLSFNTFEDTLDVKMEINGKPSNVLPFEYQAKIGGFARVDASSPGSYFEGINLDVNLKLPFNEVMKFGNKLKSIFN